MALRTNSLHPRVKSFVAALKGSSVWHAMAPKTTTLTQLAVRLLLGTFQLVVIFGICMPLTLVCVLLLFRKQEVDLLEFAAIWAPGALLGYWLGIAIHEVGHWALLAAHGHSIRLFSAAGWTWARRGGKWKFLGFRRLPIANVGGLVVPDRRFTQSASRDARLWLVLGGPLASLACILIAVLAGVFWLGLVGLLDAASWTFPARVVCAWVFITLSLMAAVSATSGLLLSLLPIPPSLLGLETDGRKVLDLLRESRVPVPTRGPTESLEHLWSDYMLDTHPRDFDRRQLAQVIRDARNLNKADLLTLATLILASHYDDRGDFSRAERVILRARARISSEPASVMGLHLLSALDFTLSVIRFSIDGDTTRAREELAANPLTRQFRVQRDFAEVHFLLVEGRVDEARRLARRTLRRARRGFFGFSVEETLEKVAAGIELPPDPRPSQKSRRTHLPSEGGARTLPAVDDGMVR